MLNYPAVTYCRANPNKPYLTDGNAYIAGGIDQNMRPTMNVMQFTPKDRKLSIVAKMIKSRFNHTCTNYKGKIYIAGGVNFTTYTATQGTNEIKPYERISDLSLIPNIAETDIEVFEPGKEIVRIEPPYDITKNRQILIRQISMVLPMATKDSKDYLVLFGGHGGIQQDNRLSVAFDLIKKVWVEFGENTLNLAYCIGQDQPISLHTNIVDFEGEQL